MQFTCDGYPLAGLRYVPSEFVASCTTVLVHGYTAGKYSLDGLAGYLALRGLPCVTVDLAGHKLGSSGGSMSTPQVAADNVIAVVRSLRREADGDDFVLCGHSLGAAACISAASSLLEHNIDVKAVIAMAMGDNPSHGFSSMVGKKMLEQRSDYVTGASAEQFIAQLDGFIRDLPPITCPALFVAARQDVLLPTGSVFALADRLNPHCDRQIISSSHMDLPDTARASIHGWLKTVLATP